MIGQVQTDKRDEQFNQETSVLEQWAIELTHLDCSGHAFPKHFHNEYVIGVNTYGHEPAGSARLNRVAVIHQEDEYVPVGGIQCGGILGDVHIGIVDAR